jgi:hypothetical protein
MSKPIDLSKLSQRHRILIASRVIDFLVDEVSVIRYYLANYEEGMPKDNMERWKAAALSVMDEFNELKKEAIAEAARKDEQSA